MKAFVFVCLMLPGIAFAQTRKAPVKKAVKKPVVASTPQASFTRGKAVYGTYCLACHQADGSGVPNLNPPLSQTSWVLGSKSKLIQLVLNGSSGKVEIDGETFHNNMPPMGHLSDQQIAEVLTFIRNSFGNKASSVTPAEVKAVRAKK